MRQRKMPSFFRRGRGGLCGRVGERSLSEKKRNDHLACETTVRGLKGRTWETSHRGDRRGRSARKGTRKIRFLLLEFRRMAGEERECDLAWGRI